MFFVKVKVVVKVVFVNVSVNLLSEILMYKEYVYIGVGSNFGDSEGKV